MVPWNEPEVKPVLESSKRSTMKLPVAFANRPVPPVMVPVSLSAKPAFGAATALFTISTEARAAIHSVLAFDLSADGQRFVIPMVSSLKAPSIVVVQNWEELLPHKR